MTIHIALSGGGNLTETHARAARAIPGVEVSAIHGTNAEKLARLRREHGGTPYQDFEAFLKHRPMDLVIIGSPSGLHATQGIAAARRGLHVLTEKPIEISTPPPATLIFVSGLPVTPRPPTAADPGHPPRVEISGTEGPVILEHDRIIAANLRDASAAAQSAAIDENQSASSAAVSDFRGHQAVLEDFLQAIQQHRAPACDGLEGRRSIALVEAIYRAAKTPDRVATV